MRLFRPPRVWLGAEEAPAILGTSPSRGRTTLTGGTLLASFGNRGWTPTSTEECWSVHPPSLGMFFWNQFYLRSCSLALVVRRHQDLLWNWDRTDRGGLELWVSTQTGLGYRARSKSTATEARNECPQRMAISLTGPWLCSFLMRKWLPLECSQHSKCPRCSCTWSRGWSLPEVDMISLPHGSRGSFFEFVVLFELATIYLSSTPGCNFFWAFRFCLFGVWFWLGRSRKSEG